MASSQQTTHPTRVTAHPRGASIQQKNRPQASRHELLENLGFIAICTSIFWLVAHAYGLLGNIFSYDSLEIVMNQESISWQISIGRFMEPVYWLFRTSINVPWLIGMIALVWLIGAITIIVTLFGFKSKVSIALVCGVLTINSSLAQCIAAAVPSIDNYTLSLLFAALSVYLTRKVRFGWLISIIPTVICIGLYQSYATVIVTLYLMLLIKDVVNTQPTQGILRKGLTYLVSLLVSALVYYLIYTLVLNFTGTAEAASYNSLAQLKQYDSSFFSMIIPGWLYPFWCMIHPNTASPMQVSLCNVILFVVTMVSLVVLMYRNSNRTARFGWCLFLLLLLPFGMNFVYILSQGFIHDIMTYSFCLIYLLPIYCLDVCVKRFGAAPSENYGTRPASAWIRGICFVLIGLIIFNSAAYANDIYLKKELEFQAANSVMTRIVDRIEQTPGYVLDETPVVLIGSFEQSELFQNRPGFEHLTNGFSMGKHTPVLDAWEWFTYIMGYPIQLHTRDELAAQYADRSEVKEMPAFPADGSIKMIDGVMVVKVSE